MFANIENKFKILENDSSSISDKLSAYEEIKKELLEIEKITLIKNVKKTNNIDYRNVDKNIQDISNTLSLIDENNINKEDIHKLVQLNVDIFNCKDCLVKSKKLNIFNVDNSDNIKEISKNIKKNLIMEHIDDVEEDIEENIEEILVKDDPKKYINTKNNFDPKYLF